MFVERIFILAQMIGETLLFLSLHTDILGNYPVTKSEGYSFGVVSPHFLSIRSHTSVPVGQI